MSDISLAEKRAEELLERFGIDSYPVDVVAIAELLGIKVVANDMDGAVSGFLRSKNGITVIGVNEKNHIKRQRFTIAHEIGHFALHLDESSSTFIDKSSTSAVFNRDNESSKGIHDIEIQANAFAAALIMPEKLVRDSLKKYLIRYSSIEDIAWKMAKDFNVSEQAMTLRLVKLSIFS